MNNDTKRDMKKLLTLITVLVLGSICWMGCTPEDLPDDTPVVNPTPEPEPEPEPEDHLSYETLDDYAPLKDYVDRTASPDFKLGLAIPVNDFINRSGMYHIAVENFDEMTAENAMKASSIVRQDGSMDFYTVRRFLEAADAAGMTVYGHTLAWHSQQPVQYLNSLIQGKEVELPDGQVSEIVMLDLDFNDGRSPFIGWGNNSSIRVENGAFKVSNPSVKQNWEVQFAYDVQTPFTYGREYKMRFRIKGSSSGRLSSGFQITDGYKSAGDFPDVRFDTQWKEVEITCKCNAYGATRLVFSYGDFAGDIYIDDFTLIASVTDYEIVEMTPQEKKEVLTEAMERWIKAVMEVTATKVSVWDAVNEAISGRDNDGDGFYELESAAWGSSNNFYWQDYLGSEDYVPVVIAAARKYYAECGGTKPLKLFINDYNLESDWDDNKKLKSLINWIRKWESDGVTRIDGIGTQMHISYYEDQGTQASKEQHIVRMLQLMANTGKLVKISELDMGYVDRYGNTLQASQLTDRQHRAMADYYRFIVSKYFEIVPPAQQYGIAHWCVVDVTSGWRANEPAGLWDVNFNRKYAYAGFADGLRGK